MKVYDVSDSIIITQEMINKAVGFTHTLFSPVRNNKDGSSADGKTVYTASGTIEEKNFLKKGLNFIIRPLSKDNISSNANNLAKKLIDQTLTPTRVRFMAWDNDGEMVPVRYNKTHKLASCGLNIASLVVNDENVVLFAFILDDNALTSYRLWRMSDDGELKENSVNSQTQLYLRCVNIEKKQTQDFHEVLRGDVLLTSFKESETSENVARIGSNSGNTTGLEEVGF